MFCGYSFLVFLVILSGNSGLFASLCTEQSLSVPFHVVEYISKYKGYVDTCYFASVPIDRPHCFVYYSSFGVNQATAAGS